MNKIDRLYHWLRGQDPRIKHSSRYAKGLASYGKKVKTEKRKARIQAELVAMGVKIKVRRPMRRREVDEHGKVVHHWPRYTTVFKYTLILGAFFLSSAAEARHGDYSTVGISRLNGPRNFVLGGASPRPRIPPATFNTFRPPVIHQDLIWPPFPTKGLPKLP